MEGTADAQDSSAGDKPSGDDQGGLEPENEIVMGGTPGTEDSGAGGEVRRGRNAMKAWRKKQNMKRPS